MRQGFRAANSGHPSTTTNAAVSDIRIRHCHQRSSLGTGTRSRQALVSPLPRGFQFHPFSSTADATHCSNNTLLSISRSKRCESSALGLRGAFLQPAVAGVQMAGTVHISIIDQRRQVPGHDKKRKAPSGLCRTGDHGVEPVCRSHHPPFQQSGNLWTSPLLAGFSVYPQGERELEGLFWVHASACEMRLATLRSRPEAGQVRGIPVSTGRRASSATVLSLPPLSSYFQTGILLFVSPTQHRFRSNIVAGAHPADTTVQLMSSAAAEDLVPHHPSSPGLICFAEQRARGCHTGLVENAAIVAERAGKRLRSSTVQPPCLPSLGQQQLPLDIPVGPNATCASASSTAYPLSFRAHLSGTELAIIHPPTHPHGAALLYRPNGRPAMSASLVHPKLDTLPALDMESDRLARACGQGPSFSARSSFSEDAGGPSYHDRPRTPERRGQSSSSLQRGSPPRWEYSDFSGLGLGPGPGLASPRGIRPRPHSVRVPARVSPVPPIPHRPRSFSQPASIPVFSPSSPRPVLRSLQAVLDRDDVQLADCLDVQSVLERWAIHRRLRPVAAVEGQEGATNKTFGSPVTVAVKCASMSTVLGGYQHPIPWVVYACVEELNRTGIYQPGLFRAVPNRSRLEKLISGFDCALPPPRSESPCPPCVPTVSSTRASLRKESMADVCALLKSYMDSLPEPLLHDNITSALHRLCVVPSDKREQEKPTCEHHESGGYFHLPPSISSSQMSAACTHSRTRSDPVSPKSLSPLLMTPSERRSADLSLENSQIHIAQHLLRLTAPPLCSLFAYLCAFFTQLPLSPDNGITLEDVSRMFGRSLAGGPVSTRNAVLMWLLERWPRVADGIFSICSGDPDEDEDVATSVYPPFAPAIAPCTDDATQSPDSTPHPPYSVPEVSVIEVRRRGSLISLDGTESVFTASTTSSDDGVHGVRTPFSSEFPPLPLPAVREYEFEPEWEEPPSVHPMLNGGVGNGMAALSSSTEAHSPGSSSQAILALHTAADGSLDFKRPALSHSRTDSLRSPSPHSPPPDSEYDSPSPSAAHSRSASRAGASSSQVEGASRPTPESPLSIFRRFGFKESNPHPHRSLSVRKKKKITTPHRRGASDADSASSGAVEH